MPIVRLAGKLVYFAHIPKCAGSSVEDYLAARFGPLALLDRAYLSVPEAARWSRSSPQHVDAAALARLFPPDFFAAAFAVVRHPLARALSAWRYQAEVEGTTDAGFGAWLETEAGAGAGLEAGHDGGVLFRFDNHALPQTAFLPAGVDCKIFHLEHGLDAVIPWLDGLAGDTSGPRAMGHVLPGKGPARGSATGPETGPATGPAYTPTEAEIARVAEIYAADFKAFGYVPGQKAPVADAPALSPAFQAANARAKARAATPLGRLSARLSRYLRRMRG